MHRLCYVTRCNVYASAAIGLHTQLPDWACMQVTANTRATAAVMQERTRTVAAAATQQVGSRLVTCRLAHSWQDAAEILHKTSEAQC